MLLTASLESRPTHRPSPHSAKYAGCARIGPSATDLVVHVQPRRPVRLAVLAARLLRELHAEHVAAGLEPVGYEVLLGRDAEEVVDVVQPLVLQEQRVAAEARAVGEDHALGVRARQLDLGEDLVRAPADVHGRRLRDLGGAGVVDVGARAAARPAGRTSMMISTGIRSSSGSTSYCSASSNQRSIERLQPLRLLGREVAGLRAVLVDVVELPLVLVEVADAGRRPVDGDGLPALLPHAARAEHGSSTGAPCASPRRRRRTCSASTCRPAAPARARRPRPGTRGRSSRGSSGRCR